MGRGRRPRGAGSRRRRRCRAGRRAADLRADVRELPRSRLHRVGRPVDRRQVPWAPWVRLRLKVPPAESRSATALPEVVARARAGRAGFAPAPNLPLTPPCGHSHAAIRLWFGRKVEVSVCVTGVNGVDLSISMERSMHAVTRTIALVLVMLALG